MRGVRDAAAARSGAVEGGEGGAADSPPATRDDGGAEDDGIRRRRVSGRRDAGVDRGVRGRVLPAGTIGAVQAGKGRGEAGVAGATGPGGLGGRVAIDDGRSAGLSGDPGCPERRSRAAGSLQLPFGAVHAGVARLQEADPAAAGAPRRDGELPIAAGRRRLERRNSQEGRGSRPRQGGPRPHPDRAEEEGSRTHRARLRAKTQATRARVRVRTSESSDRARRERSRPSPLRVTSHALSPSRAFSGWLRPVSDAAWCRADAIWTSLSEEGCIQDPEDVVSRAPGSRRRPACRRFLSREGAPGPIAESHGHSYGRRAKWRTA
mmetsp:Transcript_11585/g.36840  ORF Transcript_11585/g.36840 Transcript_11585/m.36840 type:complete len:321 (+) Transcript_11585:139-1101(+)